MTRPGATSILGRAIFGGQINTIFFNNTDDNGEAQLVDWVDVEQGGHTFTTAEAAVQGGVRVLDFGLPAYQASLFMEIPITDDGVDGQPLVIDIRKFLAHLGLNGFVAGDGMPIGHAAVHNDIDGSPTTTKLLHVVQGAGGGLLEVIKFDGTVFDDQILAAASIELMLECQLTND